MGRSTTISFTIFLILMLSTISFHGSLTTMRKFHTLLQALLMLFHCRVEATKHVKFFLKGYYNEDHTFFYKALWTIASDCVVATPDQKGEGTVWFQDRKSKQL
uniref:Uncharacterized protein n=1 Tax=Palpitomonas bilix TaxID=652834 RepID=A0A7S3GEQ6_9EUKA|mmetsp:Transcript_46417/g.119806  ORF Transcript_46417/g.119806 Transcript_46417/m.119806 type:complete len:103 (+) Transcript_46417:1096-1404(+)